MIYSLICLPDHPINWRLAHAGTATLGSGLSKNDLLGIAEAIHRHCGRCFTHDFLFEDEYLFMLWCTLFTIDPPPQITQQWLYCNVEASAIQYETAASALGCSLPWDSRVATSTFLFQFFMSIARQMNNPNRNHLIPSIELEMHYDRDLSLSRGGVLLLI